MKDQRHWNDDDYEVAGCVIMIALFLFVVVVGFFWRKL